jgi:4-hydroxythreonine-4-phosphate dehydrogenase
MEKLKPILAITMGDPAGIGPEIAAKAFANSAVYDLCRPLLIGNVSLMKKALKFSNLHLKINGITDVNKALFISGTMDVYEIDFDNDGVADIVPGVVSPIAGKLAFMCVKKAIDLALNKDVDGTVTGPINKESIHAAGYSFSGHTEIYAHYTNTRKYGMLLADENLRVVHVSTHVSMRQACDLVKKDRLVEVILLMNDALRQLGFTHPRIGVAGLNPHSSDGGLFGNEEALEISPAIAIARKKGLDVDGPVPPDSLFALANGGRFDGCVAMYHDQGHIPFKVLGFQWDKKTKAMKSVKGVNITLGLPIIRTSVDHGTAFEIAGQGIASPEALLLAINYAIKLYNNKLK